MESVSTRESVHEMTSTRHMLVILTSRRTAANKSRTSHNAELDTHMNSTPRKPSETKKTECHLRDLAYGQKDRCEGFKTTHLMSSLDAFSQRDSTLISDIVQVQIQVFDGAVGLVMFHATAAAAIAARM